MTKRHNNFSFFVILYLFFSLVIFLNFQIHISHWKTWRTPSGTWTWTHFRRDFSCPCPSSDVCLDIWYFSLFTEASRNCADSGSFYQFMFFFLFCAPMKLLSLRVSLFKLEQHSSAHTTSFRKFFLTIFQRSSLHIWINKFVVTICAMKDWIFSSALHKHFWLILPFYSTFTMPRQ